MTEPPRTLTVSQAAEALGVSERSVWRYLKAGRLAGETVGPPGAQRTLIHEAAVSAFLAARGADAPDTSILRGERDRLQEELAAVRVERDALRTRVIELERALATVRSSRARRRAWVGRLAATTLSRVRAPRSLVPRPSPALTARIPRSLKRPT